MMRPIHDLDHSTLEFESQTCEESIQALETGSVLYFPKLSFDLLESEKALLSPDLVKPDTKNISYLPDQRIIRGVQADSFQEALMQNMLERYFNYAKKLIDELFPHYQGKYQFGKTSYRPVEVKGRESSYRKDDTRLHVDAFTSNPNRGKRLLRVFCNINPNNQSRHWRVGESFSDVVRQFAPQIPKPLPGKHMILKAFGITKSLRSDYDHYMLQIHNRMKADMHYQKTAAQLEFHFPPQTTWIVFTDSVSHAAMSGQYMLEQTFYLPVEAMKFPDQAPLRVLEKMMNRKLA